MGDSLTETVQEIRNNDRTDVQIEVTVTNQCNCHCDYCFECSHEYTSTKEEEDRQVKLIADACENFDVLKHNVLRIVFWGGEPMMNTQFLYRLIGASYKYPFVEYMMYTNGVLYKNFEDLFSQEFFQEIQNRIEFQLSYDGEPHHFKKRHIKSDIIFKTADLIEKYKIPFSFKATLSFDSLELLPEVWDSYKELSKRYKNVRYSPTLDQTNSEQSQKAYEIWKRVVVEVAKKEVEFIEQNGHPLWSWFEKPGKLACHMNNAVHMHNDGKYYICHGCPYLRDKEKFVVGETKTDSILSKLNSGFLPSLRTKKCVDCCAVACQVCHVSELSGTKFADDYKPNWTRIMVNNSDRCMFFKFVGIVYHSLKMALMKKKYEINM